IETERKAFEEKDLELYLNVNDAFHLIIAESSGNGTLAGYVKNILSRIYVQTIFFESFFNFADNPSLGEHIRLIEALKKHNEKECVLLMQEHLKLAVEALGT
ncbi:MAG: GntR family transcriptional regulator, partial [Synergistaceae bacterium]|nr:GntR family transcriptional regulator [Synergistaceae bacterium]